jgi:hypothetical protein
MNTTIEITVDPGLRTLFRGLANLPELALKAVATGLQTAGPVIVGHAVKDRFTAETGPFPVSMHKLGRVSGRLRQSITNTAPQINPSSGMVTMGFGSNVKYFAFHEFGFSGQVAVRAHTRRNGAQVRAHSRSLVYPGRAPMRTELNAQRTTDTVLETVRRAVVAELTNLENGGLA